MPKTVRFLFFFFSEKSEHLKKVLTVDRPLMENVPHNSDIFEIKVPVYIKKHNVHFRYCLKIFKPFLSTIIHCIQKSWQRTHDFQKEGNSLSGRNSVHLLQLPEVDNLITRGYLLIDIEIFNLRLKQCFSCIQYHRRHITYSSLQ